MKHGLLLKNVLLACIEKQCLGKLIQNMHKRIIHRMIRTWILAPIHIWGPFVYGYVTHIRTNTKPCYTHTHTHAYIHGHLTQTSASLCDCLCQLVKERKTDSHEHCEVLWISGARLFISGISNTFDMPVKYN